MGESSSRSISVLIVNQDPAECRSVERVLADGAEDAGESCLFHCVPSSDEAAVYLQQNEDSLDAVVFDLGRPDAGYEGLATMQAASPTVAIVALTGYSDVSIATGAIRAGAADCLVSTDLVRGGLFRTISTAIERKRGEAELVRLSRTDPLTGLLNRRSFFEHLERALEQARRSELACAVMVFDIDRFKEINDVFGHKTGDDVLIGVTQHLRAQLRESDWIARIGGDEFAVLATNLRSASAAMEIAEKISKAVNSIDKLNDMSLDVSISIGISVFPMDDASAEVLLSHADLAMYKSKNSKKGSINFFDARMDAVVKARYALKSSMPDDITAGRFYLLFQPIVDAATRKIISAEGLARWRDPENRVIAPGEFIPIAEESGSIGNLGNLLLGEACSQIRSWSEMQRSLVPISLNISPIQCRDPSFGARLIETLQETRVPAELINIEITEATILKNLDVIHKNLELIRDFGVGIYIDDFGTGYSSLSLLRDLPLTALKIDRSFVRDLGKEDGAEVIVHAVVDLARKLGFTTIAEGVETEEQVGLLRDAGVNGLQGYYFSRPVAGAQLAGWLAKSEAFLVA